MAVSAAAIDNASSTELANAMAGQIARTAAIFNVDEIIVIDESSGPEYAPSECLQFPCAAFCRLSSMPGTHSLCRNSEVCLDAQKVLVAKHTADKFLLCPVATFAKSHCAKGV